MNNTFRLVKEACYLTDLTIPEVLRVIRAYRSRYGTLPSANYVECNAYANRHSDPDEEPQCKCDSQHYTGDYFHNCDDCHHNNNGCYASDAFKQAKRKDCQRYHGG